jgi:hypothetical protein
LILTPGSLERCATKEDWLRLEILQAIKSQCNIIPVYNSGYVFPEKETIPNELKDIPRYQSIEYFNQYHNAAIDKLVSFLIRDKKMPEVANKLDNENGHEEQEETINVYEAFPAFCF